MISIRKATLKDVPALVGLWKEFMKYHDEYIIKENPKLRTYLVKKKDAADNFRSYIRKNIRSKDAIVHIAEVNGKSAGYSLISIVGNVPIFKIEKIGHLNDLFVRKEFRGMRISSRFKDEAMEWFKRKGVKHISLKLYKDNRFAHSIYKRWGFFDYQTEMRREI